MQKVLKIGTRDSQLAVWQATLVKEQLAKHNIESELVFIKSDGDIDLVTPLYEIGVQGVITKTLDAALLSNKIDIAVHSMKDVPTQPAKGIVQAASYKDILVVKEDTSKVKSQKSILDIINTPSEEGGYTIATSSIRRKAQWLHRYPNHQIENLRGNVNTRLRKVEEHNWNGAIFAAAGLERLGLRPDNSVELDWMLPAPAQGAIMIVCREQDKDAADKCVLLNDEPTAICVKAERDFLRELMGGCSTPISALGEIKNDNFLFKGNIFSLDGKEKIETEIICPVNTIHPAIGTSAAEDLLNKGADKIVKLIRNVFK